MEDGKAVLPAPLLACGDAPSAPEWVSIYKRDDGTMDFFVDVSDIRIMGSLRSVWIKRVYAKRTRTMRNIYPELDQFPTPHKVFDSWLVSDLACVSFDCGASRASVGKMTWYFQTGEHYTDTLPTPWFDMKPGAAMTFVCAWKPT